MHKHTSVPKNRVRKTADPNSPFIGKDGIAARYDVGVRTIETLMAEGAIPFYRIGGQERGPVRFRVEEVDEALKALRVGI